MALETLLTERDVAKILRRSESTLRQDRMRRRGASYIKVGGSVRYQPAAIEAYLKSLERSVQSMERSPEQRKDNAKL